MNVSEALYIGAGLIAEHGLDSKGWRVALDSARTRFGLCSYRRKTISLSRAMVELNVETEVRKTILHEIAHALVYEKVGYSVGHNEEWRRVAVSIGDDGKRCYDSALVIAPPKRFKGQCPTCSRIIYRNLRVRSLGCVGCFRKTGDYAASVFRWERNVSGANYAR